MKMYVIVIVLMTLLCAREISLLPDGKLHACILDVGQGDSALLVTPNGAQIVIDGGPDLSLLSHLRSHMPFFDRSIDLLVITHFDSDHMSALPELLRRYTVDHVLMTTRDVPGVLQRALRTSVVIPDPKVDLIVDGVVLDVVWPTPGYTGSKNNRSVVLRVLYEDQSILFAGDIEKKAEDAILALGSDIRSNVLKVAHHGSKTSTSTGFLLAVGPKLAVISAGKENRFGHPHAEVMDRLHAFSIDTKTTPRDGVVPVVLYD